MDAVGLHRGDDLQIEYVASGHGMTKKQVKQPLDGMHRHGQDVEEKRATRKARPMHRPKNAALETRRALVTME